MRGIDPVPRKEVDDDDARVAEPGFAEQLRRAEGEETSNARGECAEGACFGGELRCGRGVGGNPYDDAPPVVEVGDRGVVATGRPLGESPDADDPDPRQSRRDRRG
jgi:hypothetical protein